MSTSNFDKFRLLLWKNWALQWNNKIQFGMELLFPAVFSMLLIFLRQLVEPQPMDVIIYNQSLPIDSLDLLKKTLKFFKPTNLKYHLAYSPKGPAFDKLVSEAATSLELEYSGFPDRKSMEHALICNNYIAGVQFSNSVADATKLPDKLDYALRFPSELRTGVPYFLKTWMTNSLFLPLDNIGPRNLDHMDGGIPAGYLREGFLPIQNAISTEFIRQSAPSSTELLPKVRIRRYPYPEHIQDKLLTGLANMVPLIIQLSFIYPCTYIVRHITTEKEKQLKEVMKIMGLQNWLHWMAWFVYSFIMMGCSAFLITLVLTIRWSENVAVLTYSSFTAVYFFFIVYIMASITLCFMIATFFSNANTAGAITGIIWFITYIPFTFFQLNYGKITLATKLFWSLFSNTAMGFGLKVIVGMEGFGEGLRWSNMFRALSVDDSLAMGHILVMMCISALIYMLICLYLEQIYPGDFGIPKKWNFPFTRTYWYGEKKHVGYWDTHVYIRRENADAFETEQPGKKVGLQVKHLSKNFGDKTAVRDLSLNMYEDEITVLLGHNGAGKTTTISMLTGMYPPTSGTATINGCDIRTNMDGARTSLSICPQHNILFDNLTVKDHLIFYGSLKGLKGDELNTEVTKYIEKIEMQKKENVISSQISGGMKRKLSVCAAFCGGTKVVLCDEPSSGMDPAARRQLWDLMQSEKVGRTVLLTTHFMDEADVLGDRIAIMSAGELKCHGTSFFLKKQFGTGYRLVCVKKNNCDGAEVTKLLDKYIPGIQPSAEIGAELSYQLPNSYSSDFEKMFFDLENRSEELALNGYGISLTSLEEVFLKVGAERTHEEQTSSEFSTRSYTDIFYSHQDVVKGFSLTLSRWHSMLLKKYFYTIHNKIMFAIQNLIPMVFIFMTIIASSKSEYDDLKPFSLALSTYPRRVTVLETLPNVPAGSLQEKIIQNYKHVVRHSGSELLQTERVEFIDYILELGKTIQVAINGRYIAAATIGGDEIIAWFNNKPLHSAPITVNLIHNAIAKSIIGPKAEIFVTNDPLPFSGKTSMELLDTGLNLGTQMSLNLCFCMSFVSALYVMFLVKEHESRAKLLQFVGGVNVMTFWLSHFVWDLFTFSITVVTVVLTLACFQEEGYSKFDELGRYCVILFIFGLSSLPMTYMLSGIFVQPSAGFSALTCINIFLGPACFTIVFLMRLKHFDLKAYADSLEKFCLASPHFGLAQSLNKLYTNSEVRKICEKISRSHAETKSNSSTVDFCIQKPYFGWESPGVLREITYMLITCLIFFLALFVKEFHLMDIIMQPKSRPAPPPEDDFLDDDVAKEKERIERMSPSDISSYNLVLDKVTKYYGPLCAVNQMSVAIQQSECFGLLGVNGAGKTTTFKMVAGDERISSGEAYVKGLSIRTKMKEVYQQIGYCPQFDALFDYMTGRETLLVYGLLHGIPEDMIPRMSKHFAKTFGFYKHYLKQVCAYSGGNKRKLSAALSVLANPSVVCLDEPTSGMDPRARRQFWNVVCQIREAGKSILLTSHSMEECDALCTRVAIMVNGEFKCLGSTQHLKNKFSKGFILCLKMSSDVNFYNEKLIEEHVQEVHKFIENEFPEAFLKERFQTILTFYIPLSSIPWSKIFGIMEKNKATLNIEDYSLSQTNLEQIFLEFAKYQQEDSRGA